MDEAHGPHFGSHPAFPASAVALGAAAAIVSAHKALGSLGQAALLHVSAGASPGFLPALDTALASLQTSSPSYLLLASLDGGRAAAFEGGGAAWAEPLAAAGGVRAAAGGAPGVRVLPGADPLRITLAVDGPASGPPSTCCGLGVAAALEAGGAVAEAALPGGAVVLACGAGSREGDVRAFSAALASVLAARDAGRLPLVAAAAVIPDAAAACSSSPSSLSPADALFGGRPVESVPLTSARAVGRVAAEAVTPYPPGIPALLPGEVVTAAAVAGVRAALAAGGRVNCADPTGWSVCVFVGV